jgi:lipoprotein-anchoring transpeptidase ErfK/SrfK
MQRRVLKVLAVSTLAFFTVSVFPFQYYFDNYDQGDDDQGSNYYAQNGNGKHKHKKSGGGFPSSRPATGKPVFIYNPNSTTWAAYDSSGDLVRTGHGSGGQHYCRDIHRGCKTPIGVFSVYSKQGPGFRSSKYPIKTDGGAPMPWAMFFHGGYAIHGSNSVPGFNASHGCIRVYPSDARWLNTSFLRYGSTVIVYSY